MPKLDKSIQYICEDCGKKIEAPEKKYSAWTRCDCGGQAKDPLFFKGICAHIPGYNTDGYNEGLGCHITSKSHYDRVCKEKNVTPVG